MPDPALSLPRPFVLGGSWTARPSRRSVLAWLLAIGVFAVPVPGLFRGVGAAMEEGSVLVFPHRLLHGALPNRDFLHIYGPGAVQFLAGWYKLFGSSLWSERVVGLLQHAFAAAALYALGRPWGYRVAATASSVMTLMVFLPSGLAALAWPGALALALWSLVFGVRAFHVDGAHRTRWLVAAGALAGLALSFRPDMVLALGLPWAFLWWRHRRPWLPVAGAVVGLVPVWVHVALVGPSTAWRGMVTDPLVRLRPGRNLPRPPTWGYIDGSLQSLGEKPFPTAWWRFPALAAPHQMFVWFFVVLLVNVSVPLAAWWWWRRRGGNDRLVPLVAGGLLGLGLTTQAVQRPDSTHLAWGWSVSCALLAALVAEGLRHRRSWPVQVRALVPSVAVVGLLFVVCPFYTYRPYLVAARTSVGNLPGGHEVHRDGRRFYLGNEEMQHSAQAAIDRLDGLAQRGQRLLVGPADLSRTVYSDVFFYYLFPELTPATYYVEMDPDVADRPGSGLAEDVASADWLVLTNYWTSWYEPNASSVFRSTEPNQVVADHFCLVQSFDDALVLLYRKCDHGDGVDPSTLGVGPAHRARMEAQKALREGRS